MSLALFWGYLLFILMAPIGGNFLLAQLLKVRKFQKQNILFSNLPKKRTENFCPNKPGQNFAIVSFFFFLEEVKTYIICLWNFLTFSCEKKPSIEKYLHKYNCPDFFSSVLLPLMMPYVRLLKTRSTMGPKTSEVVFGLLI